MSAEPYRNIARLVSYLSHPRPAPTLMKRILGAQLAGMRDDADLSQDQAARHLGCSPAKICRIEQGKSRLPAKQSDVAALLDLYGVGDYEISIMLQLLGRSHESGWWQRYDSRLKPEWVDRLIGLQEAATAIRTYEVHFVPGLLQTAAYTRTVIERGLPQVPRSEVERRVELRMARQEMLQRPDAPELWAVIDETVLYPRVGGPDVMRGQLRHLLEAADMPKVTLQVVPLSVTDASSPGIPITYLRFPGQDVADVVYLEQVSNALFIEDAADTEQYRATLDRLASEALDQRQTRAMIDRMLHERYN
ncbi:helix-turn-helix transcriptional regulator [Streptomyces sp. HNM0663]|uniref:Helix-turn-helix transcriptional regulator n=1 Tax=Streptomyces chengmaiensis TaxID=3040919 RepID=A0ABT6HZY7_9ACTN|nr:helix-turn-helix transcriptional regulator [Streptomyces chengmaiensis]MDH2394015.1 helix-turn-helix transcriptional regulator [Streptomyces chengmaiensis]